MPKRPGYGGVLDDRQKRFVAEYLADPELNQTRAAIAAGYTPYYAKANAGRILNRPAIRAAIDEAMRARSERTQITQDDVLKELHTILTSDVRNFHVSDDGQMTLREGIPDQAWRSVASVKHRIRTTNEGDTIREIEFRLWDKNAAAKMAGEHLGMYMKKVEHSGEIAHAVGGVLLVPGPLDAESWSLNAVAQQQALLEHKQVLAAEHHVE